MIYDPSKIVAPPVKKSGAGEVVKRIKMDAKARARSGADWTSVAKADAPR